MTTLKTTLSPIISGTMSWGIWDKKFSTREMANLMRVFYENGITSFDLADVYGGYTTEAEFGNAYSESGISREKIQLISKCGIKQSGGSRDYTVKHYDYSKEYIIWSVENSLKNLQTDHLDVLLLHRPSPLMQADEIAEAISKLKNEGKLIDFGLSNFTPSQAELLRSKIDVACNQIQFSATNFQPMLDGTIDYLQLHNIKGLAWNPLGNVFREDSEKTRSLKRFLASLVEKYGVGSDIILLAWVMKHPAGISPIAGTVNPGRIQQLNKASQMKLDMEDWFRIWAESQGEIVP